MLRTFSISGLPFSDPNDVLAALESGDALPGAREIAGDLAGWLAELRAPETGANTSTTDTKVAP